MQLHEDFISIITKGLSPEFIAVTGRVAGLSFSSSPKFNVLTGKVISVRVPDCLSSSPSTGAELICFWINPEYCVLNPAWLGSKK